MSAQDLNDLAWAMALIAFAMGFAGGFVHAAFVGLLEFIGDRIDLHADKQARIRDARWRARWQGFLSEAKQQGLQGREAILWAANAMRTHRQALRLLSQDGHGPLHSH